MEIKILQNASRVIHDIFKVSAHCYDGKQCISAHFDADGMVYICNQMVKYMEDDTWQTKYPGLKIFTSVDSVVGAEIQLIGTNYSIFLGPIKYDRISKQAVSKEELANMKQNLKDYDYLKEVYHSMKTMDAQAFSNMLSLIYMLVNNQEADPEEIFHLIKQQKDDVKEKVYNIISNLNYEIVDKHMSREFEKRLIYYIKNGMLEELNNLSKASYPGRVGKLGFDDIRHSKNMMETLNTLCIRAAIDGGVDEEVAYTTGEIFVQTIEACSTVEELEKYSANIQKTYCQMVIEAQKPQVEDIIVSKAIKYIEKNLYSKITAYDIAESLMISKEYLSTKFKKAIGSSIPDYINEKKIEVAKNLLTFTNKTLIEISDSLAFSSQSYFQNIFKKVTGETPVEFRRKSNKQ